MLGRLAREARLLKSEAVLAAVAGQQGITAGQLAAKLGIEPSALSYHLGRLLAEGRLFSAWRDRRKVLFVPSSGSLSEPISEGAL